MTYFSIIQPTDTRHVDFCVGGTTHISFCHFIASSCRPHWTVSLVRMASALPRSSCQCVSAIWQRIATPTITATFSNSSSQCQPPVSCGLRRRLLLALPFSTKAPAAKKGKKGGDEGGGSGAAETSVGDVSKVAPINIYKEGKDPPLLPDDQYPEWLFDIRVRSGCEHPLDPQYFQGSIPVFA